MTIQEIDQYFPFIVFAYGFIMTVIFQSGLIRLADDRIPEAMLNQFKANRALGLICLFVGGLWSLQALLLG